MSTHALFWNLFLPKFHAQYPTWEEKVRNPHWISCPSSKPSLVKYAGSWSKRPTAHLKAEAYIEFQSKERNKEIFDTLLAQQVELENAVGEPLKWNRKPERKKSTIELWFPCSIEILEEERWPEASRWLLSALGRVRNAFDPVLDTW